ncbi:MAG TPA: hypothetical protein PKW69_00365 [Niabella sp.]|nr:hypothetical protein [Niabella sp.]
MLKLLLLFLIISPIRAVLGQTFEGKITYQISCKSNLKDYSDEEVCAGAPSTQEYFIKNGNYKFLFSDSSDYQWMLYNNKENKIYTKTSWTDTIYWRDPTKDIDTVLEVKSNKKVINILGLLCDEVIFICKEQIHKFYYNPQISVDKDFFINHKYGNLYDFYKISNSLVLKEIIEYKYFTLESVAIEIRQMEVSEDAFKFPSTFVTSENPYW